MLPRLSDCLTDDDVAMHLLRQAEDFEKYVHYMVGQTQAEASVTEKAVQQYLNTRVTSPSPKSTSHVVHLCIGNPLFHG